MIILIIIFIIVVIIIVVVRIMITITIPFCRCAQSFTTAQECRHALQDWQSSSATLLQNPVAGHLSLLRGHLTMNLLGDCLDSNTSSVLVEPVVNSRRTLYFPLWSNWNPYRTLSNDFIGPLVPRIASGPRPCLQALP